MLATPGSAAAAWTYQPGANYIHDVAAVGDPGCHRLDSGGLTGTLNDECCVGGTGDCVIGDTIRTISVFCQVTTSWVSRISNSFNRTGLGSIAAVCSALLSLAVSCAFRS